MPTSAPIPASPSPLRALVVERSDAVRAQVCQVLALAGHAVRHAASPDEAARVLAADAVDVVLLDAGLADDPDLAALAAAAARGTIAVVTGAGAQGERAAARRLGAHACIGRPYDADEVLSALERAARETRRARELETLRGLLGARAESVLVGRSPAMQRVRELVHRAAASRASVVVSGEAGTGKELVARTIHALSAELGGPCTVVGCSDADPALLDTLLFGDGGALGRGAGGTVIVDDATSLAAPLQVRLLRALQERAAGGAELPRIIVTVREERAPGLDARVPRYDVLARAGVFAVELPPLRDRRSDIPLLAAHFRARFARETGAEPAPFAPDVVGTLLGHDWPGNVRQLELHVTRLLLMPPGARAPLETPVPSLAAQAPPPSLVEAARAAHWTLEELEREYIHRILDEERGHQSRAAQRLGIDRRTLYRKLKQYRTEDVARRRAAQPGRPDSARTA